MTKETKNKFEWVFLWAALILLVVLFASCKTPKPQTPIYVPLKTNTTVNERLVPYALPPDSSAIVALFECDSLNNVQLKELAEMKAKGWNSNISFNNGAFKYDLNKPPDTIFITGKDSIIEREIPIPTYITSDPVILYKQTDMQVIQGWFGKIFMGLLGLATVGGVILLIWKLKH